MKICVDDGSTGIKMAWRDGDAIKTAITANSFARGDAVLSGDVPALTYIVGNDRFHQNSGAAAETTTQVEYQYSAINVAAVQHALHQSGIEPQPLHIFATLPIREFYTRAGLRNESNIQRKIDNLMQPVKVIGGESFVIKSVKVVPEAIPAGIQLIRTLEEGQSVLIVDIGGTTLDLSIVGAGGRVIEIAGHPGIGVSTITENLQDALQAAHLRASASVINSLIAHHDDPDYIAARMNTPAQVAAFQKAFAAARDELCAAVVNEVSKMHGYTHVLIIGGGATLIADAVKAMPECPVDRVTVPDQPQTALVTGIFDMFGE